ncbi:uncharacterized protein C8Q71DRAFT_787118 [Rhodofomes roseus]|uniref:Uncharacterized protein n=1 Tax=Rhodofomes roseus TaxID=34475 RepID=A0ABQ8K171_9APHY|nr:uncharacterized protein C8Q71DRAFT_787118 [Rhodofomes roseus]KAH9830372.1 hypothetical protein C8Q71DRAFT_787118 [Rhodofomes roseus]
MAGISGRAATTALILLVPLPLGLRCFPSHTYIPPISQEMSSTVALSALLAAAAALSGANAQSSSTSVAPLAAQTYAYADLPYQVEPYGGERGNQVGYNKCNSTTENQDSLCQTLIANAIDDFCLWSSPKENETIGDTEAYEVAWCSKKGHGARAMPDGTLQGVSVIRTPDYVMYAGFLDQVQVNLAADDYGGELDPHGADLMGNPMGGMVYSNQYPKGNTDNNTLTQVVEWKQFIGGNQFCLMICDPSKTDANNVGLCENRYDEVGISYNCPNSAQKGKYEVCDGDSMSPIGQYVSNGVTTTWTQPWSGSWTVPYTATVPSSSNCRTFASTDLYTAGVKPTVSASGSAAGATATGTGSKGSKAGSSAGASATGSGSDASGASHVVVSGFATVLGLAAALAFLA